MSTQVTINNATYDLPTQGDAAPWGEDLTAVIQALITVAGTVTGTGDITPKSFSLTNNQSSAANITNFSFDTASVRSAICRYSIYISTTLEEHCETGHLYLSYKSTANSWDIVQTGGGTSGVVFSITSAGQVQYTSTNITGSSYVGKLKFDAKAFTQT